MQLQPLEYSSFSPYTLLLDESESRARQSCRFFAFGGAIVPAQKLPEASLRLEEIDREFFPRGAPDNLRMSELLYQGRNLIYGLDIASRQELAYHTTRVLRKVHAGLLAAPVDLVSLHSHDPSARPQRYGAVMAARQYGAALLAGRTLGTVIFDGMHAKEEKRLAGEWDAAKRIAGQGRELISGGLMFATSETLSAMRLADAAAWLARRSAEGQCHELHQEVAHLWITPQPVPTVQFGEDVRCRLSPRAGKNRAAA